MSELIDKIPALKAGMGYAPQAGGCLVQVANWLCDHTLWTDQPAHVHPVLRQFGVHVNDRATDADRRELALAVVRIAGTGKADMPVSDEVTAELEQFAVDLFTVENEEEKARWGVHWLTPNPELSSAERVERYFLLLELFEELTGHQPRQVPEEEWAELAMAMARPEPEPAAAKVAEWTQSAAVATFTPLSVSFAPVEQEAVAAKVAEWTQWAAVATKSMTTWRAPHGGTWTVSWSNGQVTSELVSAST